MINKIFNKRNVVLMLVYFSILLGIKYYQIPEFKNLIELILTVITIPFVLIFGRKILVYASLIFITSICHIDHHCLYIALCFFMVIIYIKRQWLISISIYYLVMTIVVFALDNGFHNVNIIIYYSLYAIIVLIIFFFPQIKKKELNLTEDEIFIIEELAQGKQNKEIDKFSKNTVTQKLKDACKRNNIINKHELVLLYKQSCE